MRLADKGTGRRRYRCTAPPRLGLTHGLAAPCLDPPASGTGRAKRGPLSVGETHPGRVTRRVRVPVDTSKHRYPGLPERRRVPKYSEEHPVQCSPSSTEGVVGSGPVAFPLTFTGSVLVGPRGKASRAYETPNTYAALCDGILDRLPPDTTTRHFRSVRGRERIAGGGAIDIRGRAHF